MSNSPSRAGPPAEITHLVRERMEARSRQDWARADALKAQVEAAGWRIVDHGNRTSVSPAPPAAVEIDGELRYGSAAAVPSLLDAPASTAWTLVLVASEEPERLSRLLGALRAYVPAGAQVVVVANDPSDSQAAALRPGAPDRTPIGGAAPEVLRTSARLGYAAALNIGLRRAAGELVLIADATAWPTGEAMTPLAAALHDPAAAAAGGFGLVTAVPGRLRPNALRRLEAAAAESRILGTPNPAASGIAGTSEVTALEGAWLTFRRSDYLELGPLDEHFVTPAWLDVWWTLRLRSGGTIDGETSSETTPNSAEPGEVSLIRRAVALELPLAREQVVWPPERSRLNRRNMYRVLDACDGRDELI